MAQAQVNLHHAALHLQQGQFIAGATDINRAFKLLKKNQNLFPDDVANLRLYASLKVAFGAIPDQYRWLISIVTSLNGTIAEGLQELHSILNSTSPRDNIFFEETVLYTAIAEGRLNNDPKAGLDLLHRYFGRKPATRTIKYVMAGLLIEGGQTDEAISILSHPVGVQSATMIPFLDFMMGECKLFRGDTDAYIFFNNFLTYHLGKHYIKEAHQKMAWYYLLKNEPTRYFHHMQQILIKGANTTDEDQQALYEAETHNTPHPILLRSRLYYDGGYYDKALELLTESLYGTLHQHAHRLEFLYRKGRILQAQESLAEALHYLTLTITTGQLEKYYFACSAALQYGLIHESMGSNETALKFYYLCLEMTPSTYSTSLHQKARMGINRLEK
jgi:tetratricopeptide (TPR) repeat protein